MDVVMVDRLVLMLVAGWADLKVCLKAVDLVDSLV
jgi:hypothetical protein